MDRNKETLIYPVRNNQVAQDIDYEVSSDSNKIEFICCCSNGVITMLTSINIIILVSSGTAGGNLRLLFLVSTSTSLTKDSFDNGITVCCESCSSSLYSLLSTSNRPVNSVTSRLVSVENNKYI